VQIGIVLLVYGLIHLWIKANSAVLSKMDREKYQGRVTVVRIPPSQLPGLDQEEQPTLQLAGSEIKGVLSDTFEMDCIEAESFLVDEVSYELKKE
jgi:hypothetical protein